MKLSDKETPLMRSPVRPENSSLKVRPHVVARLVALARLDRQKPASPKVQ